MKDAVTVSDEISKSIRPEINMGGCWILKSRTFDIREHERIQTLQAMGEPVSDSSVWKPDSNDEKYPYPGGRYLVEKDYKSGGMSDVYKAFDQKTQRAVAIKIMKKRYLSDDEESNTNYIGLLQKEAKTMAKVEHPNVVVIYDYFETEIPERSTTDLTSVVVMRYIDSPTMKEELKKRIFSPTEVSVAMHQLASTVDYMDSLGIRHRDLKPANIFISPYGLLVTDFGIASGVIQNEGGLILGSPHYLSPEAIREQPIILPSEVYSMATIAFEMLTGEKAFGGDSIIEIINNIMSNRHNLLVDNQNFISTYGKEVAFKIDKILCKAWQKDPDNRYQTATEFASDISIVLATKRSESPFNKLIQRILDISKKSSAQ